MTGVVKSITAVPLTTLTPYKLKEKFITCGKE
jgi:hypothetical protein